MSNRTMEAHRRQTAELGTTLLKNIEDTEL